jgi:hypothetical protein
MVHHIQSQTEHSNQKNWESIHARLAMQQVNYTAAPRLTFKIIVSQNHSLILAKTIYPFTVYAYIYFNSTLNPIRDVSTYKDHMQNLSP